MVAQDTPADTSATVMPAPKVLVIEREFVKPGRSGSMHEKSEAAFVNAMKAAKWPTHYLAAEAMSGRPRVLFMIGYPSFDAWEKDNEAMEKNAVLTTAFEKASYNDADLLTDYNQNIFVLDSENSLRPGDGVHARYFEITHFRVKPGHRREWMEAVKLYRDAYDKAVPDAHWALYSSAYGENNGGDYLVISTVKSLSEDDANEADGKKVREALGPDGMKRAEELTAACLELSESNLYHVNPRMSYADETWMKADDYWKPKMGPANANAKGNPGATKKPVAIASNQ
jgi:hypothetical protein